MTDKIEPGTLLVAHPDLDDSFFFNTVVLITESHEGGTIGFCLNQKSGIFMNDVLLQQGVIWNFDDELHIGGPVSDRALIMLHTSDWVSSNTMWITDEIAMSSDKLMTEKMNDGNTPVRYKFINGMSGWLPGQLEKEIAKNHSWLTCQATEDIVFYDGDDHWMKAIELCAAEKIGQYI